jgi:hypothetical protein
LFCREFLGEREEILDDIGWFRGSVTERAKLYAGSNWNIGIMEFRNDD